jgi:hypothetical protein
MIGRVLGIDKGTVKRHFTKIVKNADTQALNGPPPILTPAQQDQLFQAIAEAYTSGIPYTLADITSYVQRNFQVNIEKGTLSHMIDRDPRLKTCPGIPMDAKRVAVTPEQIQNFFVRGSELLSEYPHISCSIWTRWDTKNGPIERMSHV